MAAAISIYSGLTISNGTFFNWPTKVTVVAMTGVHVYENTISVATTSAGVAVPIDTNVATYGWAVFLNLDPTNYVEVGLQTGGTTFLPFIRLLPGDGAAELPLSPGVSYFARSHTAACNLQYAVLER